MKSKLLFIFSLLIGLNITAQTNGINYKAIIKDTNGNVITNTTIDVIFKIDEASTNIYSEYHTIITDNNGLIILNIGEGTATIGDFTTIDWSTNNHALNVNIGIDGGAFIDIGTTAFKAVPYAYQATKADNVTGLEKISEGGFFGWRLVDRNEAYYGDIGGGAIDLSLSTQFTDINGATGIYSFATGINTLASGLLSSSLGSGTKAESHTSIALGSYNVGGGNPNSWIETDPLFEIGNSDDSTTPSNALTVLKNGTITAPSFDISEITDPKALITKEYAEANISATGLEKITESTTGWRLTGRAEANYANIGASAVDFSTSSNNDDINGASGDFSFAAGLNTIAVGDNSTAFGFDTTSNGNISSSFGVNTIAESYAETVVGTFDTNYFPDNENAFHIFDRVFVVGNGTADGSRSDALIVNKDGTVLAPSMETGQITSNKTLITKEYADDNLTQTGLARITDGQIGWRLIGYDPANYGIIGQDAVDLSVSNTTGIFGARAKKSVAFGFQTTASGEASTAMGSGTIAIGNYSLATGLGTQASSYASIAMGAGSIAGGSYSTAIGHQVNAPSYGEVAIGYWNTNYTPNSSGSPNTDDRLFVVGNGENASASGRSNALTLFKNGNLGLSTDAPDTKLHITGGVDASNVSGTGYVVIGDLTGQNMVIDQNEIIARFNGGSSTLFLNQTGGDVWAGGALVHSSDRRLKRNITDLTYGLKEVLQLQPKQYFWKNNTNQKQESLGIIAQEIQKIIPNVVHEKDDTQKTLSVSYTELIPVLINAIKEQQKIIDNQNNKIEGLTSEVVELKFLENRLQEIEILLKNEQE